MLGGAGCGGKTEQTIGGGSPGAHARTISQGDYPGEWPFGPDKGVLRCRRVGTDRVVSFEAGGVSYALNVAARRRGLENVRSILLTDHAGLPFDYSPVLRDGLALCV
ncbi:MAG TPA: hypothetical protein VGJ27_01840 [Gaiellaceae bacterium]